MSTKKRKEVVCRGLRLERSLLERMEATASRAGYQNLSSFIRSAIERELAGREADVDETERRVVASLDRVARELRSIRLRQQAEFAFLDALVKTLLTHLHEIPKDAYDQAVARGRARYERFLKSVGMGMNGDSQAAISELMRRVEEE